MNKEMSALSVAYNYGISHSYYARLWLISWGHAMWNACPGFLSGSQVEQTPPVIVGYKWDESSSHRLSRTVPDHLILLLLFSLPLEAKRWIMLNAHAPARAVLHLLTERFHGSAGRQKMWFFYKRRRIHATSVESLKTQQNVRTPAYKKKSQISFPQSKTPNRRWIYVKYRASLSKR